MCSYLCLQFVELFRREIVRYILEYHVSKKNHLIRDKIPGSILLTKSSVPISTSVGYTRVWILNSPKLSRRAALTPYVFSSILINLTDF